MKLFFITGNEGKFKEAKEIIPSLVQLNLDLPEIQDIDPKEIIKFKLLQALKHKKGNFVIEDASLCLDCLGGLPGPLIKWFTKTIGNDGLYKIAKLHKNNKAYAKVIVGYAKNSKELHFFEGKIKGTIVAAKGEFGFGWDPIFMPEGFKKTFAQMSLEEKNKISMRKKAFTKLKKFLEKG